MAAMGGTELLYSYLRTSFPELTEQVQVICSRPEQVELDPKRPKVLWLHDLPQDPACRALRDATYRQQFNRIVFVSSWQQQQYNMVMGIPFHEGVVIKNAVPDIEPITLFPKFLIDGKLQFIYTSTPHRGLELLSYAADALATVRQDWTLHVYSSLKIYGLDEADQKFESVYERLRNNPCVQYHGSVPHDELQMALRRAHVFIYPCIYPETSCMAAQEALLAGCHTIVSNVAALPETCGEWVSYMPFSEKYDVMVANTIHYMKSMLEYYDKMNTDERLGNDVYARQMSQQQYYRAFYTWNARVSLWKNLLTECVNEGPTTPMFVVN